MLTLGSILYVALLLINAMAVLSEDRFLARSTCLTASHDLEYSHPIVPSWLGVHTGSGATGRIRATVRAAVRPSRTGGAGHWREGTAHQLD